MPFKSEGRVPRVPVPSITPIRIRSVSIYGKFNKTLYLSRFTRRGAATLSGAVSNAERRNTIRHYWLECAETLPQRSAEFLQAFVGRVNKVVRYR